jgi:hypothetical protein
LADAAISYHKMYAALPLTCAFHSPEIVVRQNIWL